MTSFVRSADGTEIAFDRLGEGIPVIVIGGMFCLRATMQELCEQLAATFTVVNYDRRGRGESGDTAPYSAQREIEDLAALIAEVGGSAALYGHSSGAGLALNAAADGLDVTHLVLHDPPYGVDDDDSKQRSRTLAGLVRVAIDEGRNADAIGLFMTAMGMPPEMAEAPKNDAGMLAVAPTMPYDFEVMGNSSRGGTIPEDAARSVSAPTLVIAGGASPAFFRDAALRLVDLLPNGRYLVLNGSDHGASAEVVAPVVTSFVSEQP
jgi:pimeloyl-ACP methyl ester carboxylesterase